MGVPDPTANKVAALTNVVVIATHTRNGTAAEQALKQLAPLLMQQPDAAGNPAFTRGQQAQIAYLEGWWAARRGDYGAAQQQADRINQLLAPDANPRKLEPMHQLEGFIALYQGKYQDAAAHLRQGNPFDPYIKYQLAVATEGAGDAAAAKKLFREIADYNFNIIGFALGRKQPLQRAGAGTLWAGGRGRPRGWRCWSWAASASTASSPCGRPTICRPTGSPSGSSPHGTEATGRPGGATKNAGG